MAYNKHQKLSDNIEAIRIALQLERDNRKATAEELSALRKYSGFGGLKFILNPVYGVSLQDDSVWKASDRPYLNDTIRLHEVLQEFSKDDKEYQAYFDSLKRSVTTAFYTPDAVVQAISKALSGSGIAVNRFLDPSSGNGKFVEAFKVDQPGMAVTAFEKDLLTGKILKALHPEDQVIVNGFETIPQEVLGTFDLTTSNIPFGDVKVFDPDYTNSNDGYKKLAANTLHNYFFLKALDTVHDGGLVAFITSRGVLDSPRNGFVRDRLSKVGHIISAVRLPDGMFSSEAGTEAGSDLIIIQKRDSKHVGKDSHLDRMFRESEKGDNGITCNWVFTPDKENYHDYGELGHILSDDVKVGKNMYGEPAYEYPFDGDVEKLAKELQDTLEMDFAKRLDVALYNKNIYKVQQAKPKAEPVKQQPKSQQHVGSGPIQLDLFAQWDEEQAQEESLEPRAFAGEMKAHWRDGVVVADGDQLGILSQVKSGTPVFNPFKDSELSQRDYPLMRQYIAVRDLYNELYNIEAEEKVEHADLRQKLNEAYDGFFMKYGALNERRNQRVLLYDTMARDMLCVENVVDGKFVKSDIFERPVSFVAYDIEHVDTPEEALFVSLNRYGRVDLGFMEDITGEGRDELLAVLKGQLYFMPDGQYEIAAKALSGNIYEKLEFVSASIDAQEDDPEHWSQEEFAALKETKAALEAAVPQQIPFDEIGLQFGERWIPTEHYEAYMSKVFGTKMSISYAEHIDEYSVSAEIRFIQEAKNEKQRKQMIEDMNDGKIRVLFGSTSTLGTGVNAQKRAVAVHHIDIPWRPSDLEQRNGRARRTGNWVAKEFGGNNVDVLIYAVERSLDVYKFNLLRNKQLFITQLKTNSLGTRVIDEGAFDEENGMNFAEMVAILSGNDDLLQKAKLEKKIMGLESERKSYMQARRDTEWRLENAREKFQKNTVIIKNMTEDYDKFQSVIKRGEDGIALPGLVMMNEPEFTPDGKYNIEGMGSKLQDAGRTVGNKDRQVGEVYGFPFIVDSIYMYDNTQKKDVFAGNRFYVQGHYQYEFNNGHLAMSKDNRLGAVRYGVQALDKIPSYIAQYEERNRKISEDISEYERIAGKAWPKEEELASLKHDMEELDKKIQASLDETVKSLPKQEEPVYKIYKEGRDHKVAFNREVLDLVSLSEMREAADTGSWRERAYVHCGTWCGNHLVSAADVEGTFSQRQKAEEWIKEMMDLQKSRVDDKQWLEAKAAEDTDGYMIHQDNEVIFAARKRLAEMNGEVYSPSLPDGIRQQLYILANKEDYHSDRYSKEKTQATEARKTLNDYGIDWHTNLSLDAVGHLIDKWAAVPYEDLSEQVNATINRLDDMDQTQVLAEERDFLNALNSIAGKRFYNQEDRQEALVRLGIYADFLCAIVDARVVNQMNYDSGEVLEVESSETIQKVSATGNADEFTDLQYRAALAAATPERAGELMKPEMLQVLEAVMFNAWYDDENGQAARDKLSKEYNLDWRYGSNLNNVKSCEEDLEGLSDEAILLSAGNVAAQRIRGMFNYQERNAIKDDQFDLLQYYFDHAEDEIKAGNVQFCRDFLFYVHLVREQYAFGQSKALYDLLHQQPLGYDYDTHTFSGVPADVKVICGGEPDRIREIYGYTPNDDIDLVHFSAQSGREYDRTFARVWVEDKQAESPAKIVMQLEQEGYDVGLHGERGRYVDFDTWQEAVAFEQHVRDIEQQLHPKESKYPEQSQVELTAKHYFQLLKDNYPVMGVNIEREMKELSNKLAGIVLFNALNQDWENRPAFKDNMAMQLLRLLADKNYPEDKISKVADSMVAFVSDAQISEKPVQQASVSKTDDKPIDYEALHQIKEKWAAVDDETVTTLARALSEKGFEGLYDAQEIAAIKDTADHDNFLNIFSNYPENVKDLDDAGKIARHSRMFLREYESMCQLTGIPSRIADDFTIQQRNDSEGLSEQNFYGALLRAKAPVVDANVKFDNIAQAIAMSVDNHTKAPDWQTRESIQAQLRVQLKRVLRAGNYPADSVEAVVDGVMSHILTSKGEEKSSVEQDTLLTEDSIRKQVEDFGAEFIGLKSDGTKAAFAVKFKDGDGYFGSKDFSEKYGYKATTNNGDYYEFAVDINRLQQTKAKEVSMTPEESPMMKQFHDLKEKHPDALLLFRCGDFYETYEKDAKTAADTLGITLTWKNAGADFNTYKGALAAFPHHALDTYLPKLIRAGLRVAICDQLEDPKETKKLVKRGITETVEPSIGVKMQVVDRRSSLLPVEKSLMSQIVSDLETGNHLLGRKRPEGYWEFAAEHGGAVRALKEGMKLTDRQRDILLERADNYYGGIAELADMLNMDEQQLRGALIIDRIKEQRQEQNFHLFEDGMFWYVDSKVGFGLNTDYAEQISEAYYGEKTERDGRTMMRFATRDDAVGFISQVSMLNERHTNTLRDGLIEKMRRAGIDVNTDWQEGERVLQQQNAALREQRVVESSAELSTVLAGEITRQDVERAMDSHLVKSWLKAKNSNDFATMQGFNLFGSGTMLVHEFAKARLGIENKFEAGTNVFNNSWEILGDILEFAKQKGLDAGIADKYDLSYGSDDVKSIMEHPEAIYTEEELAAIEKVLSPQAFDDFKALVRSFSEAKAIQAEEERIKNYNGGEALTKAFVLYDIAQRRLFAEHQGDERWFRRSEYIIKADGTTAYGGVNQQPKEGETLGSKWVLKNSVAKELMSLIATSPVTEKVLLLEMMPSGLQRYFDIPSKEERQAELRQLSDEMLDALYVAAMPDNKAVMRDVLDVMAERRGYTLDSSYQGSLAFNGAAPCGGYYASDEERLEAWENEEFEGNQTLADYINHGVDISDLEFRLNDPRGKYTATDERIEAIDNINKTIAEGKGTITMYRAVPANIEETIFRNGDWITPSRKYADLHAEINGWDDYRVIEQEVSIDSVWWDGNDIAEWGFDDGMEYRYKNTPNNAKLNDLITYDTHNNVILPSKRFDDRTSDIRYMLAPDSQSPIFISNAWLALNKVKQDKATPEQWLKMLEKLGGIKAGEDRWTGLSQWLKDSQEKSLSKMDIAKYLHDNMINVEEVHYIEARSLEDSEQFRAYQREFDDIKAHINDLYEAADNKYGEFIAEMTEKYGQDWMDQLTDDEDRQERYLLKVREDCDTSYHTPIEIAYDEMISRYGDDWGMAFSYYQEDGQLTIEDEDRAVYFLGDEVSVDRAIHDIRLKNTTKALTNKREIALTVPSVRSYIIGGQNGDIHFDDADDGRAIAWVRFGDTVDAEGHRVLVIDEIQSKRHQDGREKGYLDIVEEDRLKNEYLQAEGAVIVYRKSLHDKYPEMGDIARLKNIGTPEEYAQHTELTRLSIAAERALIEYHDKHSVPDAPFEKNWQDLCMKRMLRYAAENGYDRVAWLNGQQQVERYDLSKNINFVSYNKETQKLLAGTLVDGVIDYDKYNIEETVEPDELSKFIGKDLAPKVLEKGILQGDDLRVGGDGMKAFYDEMLPNFMNKYGKQWGVHVEDMDIPALQREDSSDGVALHGVKVTEQMKQDVLQGQPMFFRSGEHQAYGFVHNGTIYIDPRIATAETPLHEYTHLWAEVLRQRNPQEWQNIVQMMKDTPEVWNYVIQTYPHLKTDDQIADEALAQFSGKRGYRKLQELVDGKQDADTIMGKMMEALAKFWNHVADFFGIHYTNKEEVADRILYDLLNEVNPLDFKIENVEDLREDKEQQIKSDNFKEWFGDWEKSRLLSQVDLEKMQEAFDEIKANLPKVSREAREVYDDFAFDMGTKYGFDWLEKLTDEEREEEHNLLDYREKYDLNENDINELAFEELQKRFSSNITEVVSHSNGQLYTLYEPEELETSKVVDEAGRPLVVEHGTRADFTTFDMSHIGENSKDNGLFGAGFYFGTTAPGWLNTDKGSIAKAIKLYEVEELRGIFAKAEPDANDVAVLQRWLREHKNDSIVLYHGTDASLPISQEGLKKTSARTARSLQSGTGNVYLTPYPSYAKAFGQFAYPDKEDSIAVYDVAVKVSDLRPDKDQLKNKRMAGVDLGNSLAASLLVGHSATVKHHIMNYDLQQHSNYHVMKVYLDIKHPFEVADNIQHDIYGEIRDKMDSPAMRGLTIKGFNDNEIQVGALIDHIKAVDDLIKNSPDEVNKLIAEDEELQYYHSDDRERLWRSREIAKRSGIGSIAMSWQVLISDQIGSYMFTAAAIQDGYDGVIVDRGEGYKEYVVFEPSQIKSATDNIGLFSKENNDIRYHFIGEQGAQNLDNNTGSNAMDMLHQAKLLADAGASAKDIKIVTGWERGADNQWRYEIQGMKDFNIRGNIDWLASHPEVIRYYELQQKEMKYLFELPGAEPLTDAERHELETLKNHHDVRRFDGRVTMKNPDSLTLKDYMDAPQLFAAYPELKDVEVSLAPMPEGKGGSLVTTEDWLGLSANQSIQLNAETMALARDSYSISARQKIIDAFDHEVQHAIQQVEGFAQGGSPGQRVMLEGLALQHAKDELDVILSNPDYKAWQKADKNYRLASDKRQAVLQHENRNYDALVRLTDAENNAKREAYMLYSVEVKHMDQRAAQLRDQIENGLVLTYDDYHKLAGETEARDVVLRRGLTDEQRRQTLASETEDVPRDQQIVTYEKSLLAASMTKEAAIVGMGDAGYMNSLALQQAVEDLSESGNKVIAGYEDPDTDEYVFVGNSADILSRYKGSFGKLLYGDDMSRSSEFRVPRKDGKDSDKFDILTANLLPKGYRFAVITKDRVQELLAHPELATVKAPVVEKPSEEGKAAMTIAMPKVTSAVQLDLFADGLADDSQQEQAPVSRDLSQISLPALADGEHCYVERKYTETGAFSFVSGDHVESSADVAYIFKSLADKSVENSFICMVKDGVPTVIHLGIGSSVAVMAPIEQALVAYAELKPEKVWFIHNHPSGNLKVSREDIGLQKRMVNIFGGAAQPGIIINTTSGKFVTYTSEAETLGEEQITALAGSDNPVKVWSFDRQVFSKDWNPQESYQASTASRVAAFVSSHRYGDRDKLNLLITNHNNNVTGNVFLPWTDIKDACTPDGVSLIARYVQQMGGTGCFLYGSDNAMIKRETKSLNYLSAHLNQYSVILRDVMSVVDENYYSAHEQGILTPYASERSVVKDAVAEEQAVSPKSFKPGDIIITLPDSTGARKVGRVDKVDGQLLHYTVSNGYIMVGQSQYLDMATDWRLANAEEKQAFLDEEKRVLATESGQEQQRRQSQSSVAPRRLTAEDREAGSAMVDHLQAMGITVSTDSRENRRVLKDAQKDQSEAGKVRHFKTEQGDSYGFAYKGKIHLDLRKIDAELPLHEYAHLWCEALRRINPDNWNSVVTMMKQDADTWQFVKSAYPELTDDNDLAEEVIAHYSGKRGAQKLQAELERMTPRDADYSSRWGNIYQNVAKAVQDFWKHIGDSLNFHYESKEDIADQILNDFAKQVNPVQKVEKWLAARDKEYAAAVEAGDIDKARDMFWDALHENVGNGITPFMAVDGYRGKLDQLAHAVKELDNTDAIIKAADLMAPFVRAGMVLVPAPSHTGKATDMKDLAWAISRRSFAPVADVLVSDPRESQYEYKYAHDGKAMPADALGIRMEGELPADRLPVVIDNVVHSGNTAEACIKALGGGVVLALASAVSQEKHVASLKSLAPVVYDKEGKLVPLSERFEFKNKYLGRVMNYKDIQEMLSAVDDQPVRVIGVGKRMEILTKEAITSVDNPRVGYSKMITDGKDAAGSEHLERNIFYDGRPLGAVMAEVDEQGKATVSYLLDVRVHPFDMAENAWEGIDGMELDEDYDYGCIRFDDEATMVAFYESHREEIDYRNSRYDNIQDTASNKGQAAAETLSLNIPVQYIFKPVPPMQEWVDVAVDKTFLSRPQEEQERLRYRKGETLEEYKNRNQLYWGHSDFAYYFWQKYADRQDEVKAILGDGLTDDNYQDVIQKIARLVDSKIEGYEIRSLLNYNKMTEPVRFHEVYEQAFEQRLKEYRDHPVLKEVQGLKGYTVDEIKELVRNHIEDNYGELFMDDGFVIKEITIIGSRSRGEAREDSDLDILLEYGGIDMKEDAMFNILNYEPFEIEGIKVDINPICEHYSLNTADWLARDAMWREEDLKKQHNKIKNMDINENLQQLLAEVMPREGMRYDFGAGFVADDLDHRVTKDELLVKTVKNTGNGYLAGEDIEGYLNLGRLSINEQNFIYKLIREKQLAELIGEGRQMDWNGLGVGFDQNPDTGNFKEAHLRSLSVENGQLVFDGTITDGDHVGEEPLNFLISSICLPTAWSVSTMPSWRLSARTSRLSMTLQPSIRMSSGRLLP